MNAIPLISLIMIMLTFASVLSSSIIKKYVKSLIGVLMTIFFLTMIYSVSLLPPSSFSNPISQITLMSIDALGIFIGLMYWYDNISFGWMGILRIGILLKWIFHEACKFKQRRKNRSHNLSQGDSKRL